MCQTQKSSEFEPNAFFRRQEVKAEAPGAEQPQNDLRKRRAFLRGGCHQEGLRREEAGICYVISVVWHSCLSRLCVVWIWMAFIFAFIIWQVAFIICIHISYMPYIWQYDAMMMCV